MKEGQTPQIVSIIFQWNDNEKKESQQQVDCVEHGNAIH